MDYVLSTDALTKRYGRFRALDGLNMNVPKGAIYGFVGKNGAGKTTLIRLVCGLQRPSSGSFRLYGRDGRDPGIRNSRRRIGAVRGRHVRYFCSAYDCGAEEGNGEDCLFHFVFHYLHKHTTSNPAVKQYGPNSQNHFPRSARRRIASEK